MNRSEFLAGLIEHGAKLKDDYPDVVGIYTHASNIKERHWPTATEDGGLALTAPTSDEEAQVQQIVAVLSPANAAFDPSLIWAIASFAVKNPEFVGLVWKLIGRKK